MMHSVLVFPAAVQPLTKQSDLIVYHISTKQSDLIAYYRSIATDKAI